ncbi:MAG TPA: hypothetical protein VGW38_19315 [Chloroflexota bacterium]|nr:hypothetical protein [Chloroflexota bacterium]
MPGGEPEPPEKRARREPAERDEDRTLRYRLRRARQQRRWHLPLEEELTPIFIADTSSDPPGASGASGASGRGSLGGDSTNT